MKRVLRRITKLVASLFLLATFAFGMGASRASAVALEYEFYTPPSTTSGIPSIALGPDGNMWFVKPNQDQIGKVTPSGVITEYDLNASDRPLTIAAGPDGNMWFTTYSKKIGKSTTSGSITYYDVSSDLGSGYAPWGIAAGPDGNMWVNAPIVPGGGTGGRIIKITTSGAVTVYNTSIGSKGIVAGSDGNVWFAMGGTSGTTNYIGRITTSGVITEFELPGLGTGVSSVTLGPDGNVWYVRITGLNNGTGKIGKITPAGVATEYSTGTSIFTQTDVALGPDGKIWFTDGADSILGEIDTSGNVSTYELPANTFPFSVTTGSDNKIWFGNQLTIGKITNTPLPPPPPPPGPENPPQAPKSGKILGAVIATASLLSIIVLATLEVKKSKLETKNSTK